MSFRDFLFWASRQYRKRLFESILIVITVGLGVGVIVSVLALFEGVRVQQVGYLKNPNYRTIRITALEDISAVFAETSSPLVAIPSMMHSERVEFTLDDLAQLKAILPSDYVFVQQQGAYSSILSSSEASTTTEHGSGIQGRWMEFDNFLRITACTPDFFQFMEFDIASGSFFTDLDVEQGNQVIVLGSKLSERLFGNDDPIGRTVSIGADQTAYSVVGTISSVTVDSLDGTVFSFSEEYDVQGFIPLTARPAMRGASQRFGVQSVSLSPVNSITEIRVGLSNSQRLGSALREVREYVDMIYGGSVSLYSPFEALQSQQERFMFMGMVVALFASVGLLIAAVNILNLMLARILRRRRLIGISVALGANRRTVFLQFLIEACLLGVVGSVVGIGMSYAGVRLISSIVDQPVHHSLAVQGIGTLIALVVSLVFGVYPAYQASRTEPVNAIRMD